MTGEDWEYTNWYDREPNNSCYTGNHEDCVQILRPGRWNDAECARTLEYIFKFSGPTFHTNTGECDTGVIDTNYDMSSCGSSAALDAIAECTTCAVVQDVEGLSQATKDAIKSSSCSPLLEKYRGRGSSTEV